MKKLLLSLATIFAVLGVGYLGYTGAFFSDTETSTGNTFAAGDIDLQIDNESYAIDHNIPGYEGPTGEFVVSDHTSWELTDLTVEKFFDFIDLKPGDYGEDTISVHVGSNDAWVCAAARVTENADNTCTEPEQTDELAQCGVGDPLTNGDLAQAVNFAFWVDDGDNVYEPLEGVDGTPESIFLEGPISGLGEQGQIPLADTTAGVLGAGVPIPGGTTFYIGKIWCFGELTEGTLSQDGVNTGSPLDDRGTGFTCDGTLVNNVAQTDSVVGDLQFYAVQARNNTTFTCAQNYTPVWPSEPV